MVSDLPHSGNDLDSTNDERVDVISRRHLLSSLTSAGFAIGGGFGQMTGRARASGHDNPANTSREPLYAADLTEWHLSRRLTEELCLYPFNGPEIYGPTAINAQSSNQRLAVGINRAGTITTFRWPRPSFYDQIKHKTSDRDRPRYGAHPNTGAFLGLVIERDGGSEMEWLRDWDHSQRYVHDLSDTIETEYRSNAYGLTVTVRDLTIAQRDAFVRRVTVTPDVQSELSSVQLVAFENFNLVVSKHARIPTRGWCEEWRNDDNAAYHADLDGIVHTKEGADESTGETQRVAVGMGFAGSSDGHQVGGDFHEPAARTPEEAAQDAYEDADNGELRGSDAYTGQTTGALVTTLDLTNGSASEHLIFAAGREKDTVRETLDRVRNQSFEELDRTKRAFYSELLADAPLPATDGVVESVAKRALVLLVSNYDRESGAIIASIANQSPYYLDWVRDGAFFNYVLDLIGLHDWVEKRNRWYAQVQQSHDDPRPSHPDTPDGNWAMNYYGDGIAGGPIPYEIDETGFGLWTLWHHYSVTSDADYLASVYPAIERAAEFLVDCTDKQSGLQCHAWEDDHLVPSQTIVGASAVWLGLDSATRAASEMGNTMAAARYEDRRTELGDAIDEQLWDPAEDAYGTKRAGFPDPTLAWPARFKAPDHPRMEQHLDALFRLNQQPSYREPEAGEKRTGLYEAKSLIPNAIAWRGTERAETLREGLDWIAERHATPDTHVMGEVWLVESEEVKAAVSQPHVWEHVLFYLASLELYPPTPADSADGWKSVTEELLEQQ